MKKITIVLIAFLVLVSAPALGGEIEVEVAEIPSREGRIVIGLYEEDGFPETGEELNPT
ncbi:MAG: hypothetical protein ACOC86_04555 [Candidatus Bipolaricaulota bacterium]